MKISFGSEFCLNYYSVKGLKHFSVSFAFVS